MLDYETLKLVWWLLVGALLIGFAVMDGHDMGVGALLPYAGRSDLERRAILNTVGPHWDGNQVWFITAGGAIFAAWPLVYAVAFSGFYWAMLAVLWALFFRPVGFDYRSKIAHPGWRRTWDWGLFIGGAVPPLIFGVAFGNLLQGVPFHLDEALRPHYGGSFFGLLNPFALLCGVVASAMLLLHGAAYLAHRTEGEIAARAQRAGVAAGALLLLAFSAAGLWLDHGITGYAITSAIDPNAAADPLAKTVVRQAGAWLGNYAREPLLWAVPALAYLGGGVAMAALMRGRGLIAFVGSAAACAGVIATAGVAMFPFVLPSSTHPGVSLTVWDAVSSRLTLMIMFWATVLFLPLVIGYTAWAYRVMAGKVTTAWIRENDHSAY